LTQRPIVSAAQLISDVPKWLRKNVSADAAKKLETVPESRIFTCSKNDLINDYGVTKGDASTLLAALWPYRGIPPSDQLQRYAN